MKLCTFLTWNIELEIACESMIETGVKTVTKIQCQLYKKHSLKIDKDEQIKG